MRDRRFSLLTFVVILSTLALPAIQYATGQGQSNSTDEHKSDDLAEFDLSILNKDFNDPTDRDELLKLKELAEVTMEKIGEKYNFDDDLLVRQSHATAYADYLLLRSIGASLKDESNVLKDIGSGYLVDDRRNQKSISQLRSKRSNLREGRKWFEDLVLHEQTSLESRTRGQFSQARVADDKIRSAISEPGWDKWISPLFAEEEITYRFHLRDAQNADSIITAIADLGRGRRWTESVTGQIGWVPALAVHSQFILARGYRGQVYGLVTLIDELDSSATEARAEEYKYAQLREAERQKLAEDVRRKRAEEDAARVAAQSSTSRSSPFNDLPSSSARKASAGDIADEVVRTLETEAHALSLELTKAKQSKGASHPDILRLQQQLRLIVEKSFEVRQDHQAAELDRLKVKLDSLSKRIAERKANRDAIIKTKLEQLAPTILPAAAR